jgi:hypothetical protein
MDVMFIATIVSGEEGGSFGYILLLDVWFLYCFFIALLNVYLRHTSETWLEPHFPLQFLIVLNNHIRLHEAMKNIDKGNPKKRFPGSNIAIGVPQSL